MKYTATQTYKSSYLPGGIAAGEVIDLTDAEAEDINRDAPGTLVPFVEERKQEPAENRMVTKSHNRKAAT
jgi:hypothetical protein